MRMLDRRSALQLGAGAVAMIASPGFALARGMDSDAGDVLKLKTLISKYLWALDTSDQAGMAAVFAPGATVHDADGKVWRRSNGGTRAFVAEQAKTKPGGQHYVQVNRAAKTGSRYRVESYWSRVEWIAGTPAPLLTALGSFVDTFVQHRGDWLLGDRRIALWNSATVKVAVVQENAA